VLQSFESGPHGKLCHTVDAVSSNLDSIVNEWPFVAAAPENLGRIMNESVDSLPNRRKRTHQRHRPIVDVLAPEQTKVSPFPAILAPPT
jgi:hypothetical protein